MEKRSAKISHLGLTFDDVLVIPAYSEILPREVDVTTHVTRNIKIQMPIVSAAMDTVTSSRLAIAIAREGGVGVLHKNMNIDEQAEEVRRVKRSESGMIIDPITLSKDSTIGQAHAIMREYSIGGIPIVDEANILVGILTNRDLRFEEKMDASVEDLMTSKNLITAPEGTDLKQAESILQKHKIEKLPVVDGNNKLVGLITYKDILKVQNHPFSCKDELGRLRVGAAIGVSSDLEERLAALVEVGVDFVCLDSAHGHSKGILEAATWVKKNYPNLDLIGGNVATAEGALALVKAGVDAVKVGVGPGSICTTRIVAGVGVPQLQAIIDCSEALKGSGVPVIGDGGVRYSGDLVKALAAGADCIMAGSLFAGTEESPGETIIFEGRKFKSYRGMGSLGAMKKGSGDRYFQDPEEDIKKLVPEGIEGRVAYKGQLAEVMLQFIGGLRAGMGYAGAKDINTLKEAKFVQISGSGIRESHPHDVVITKESPNYSR